MNSFLVELRRADDQIEKTHEEDRPPTVPVAKHVRPQHGAAQPCACGVVLHLVCHIQTSAQS